MTITKKTLILIIGLIAAIPAICQTELTRKLYSVPDNTQIIEEPTRILMRLRMGEVYDHVMMGGLKHWYLAESNVDSLNQIGDKIRVLSIQVPYTMYFGLAERKKMQDLINSFVTPTEPKPDIVTITDSSPLHSRNAYYGNWRHASGSSWLSTFHEQTASYNQSPNDSLVIEFDGYRIQWYTEKLSNHGMAEVKIDGQVIQFKDAEGKPIPGLDLYAPGTVNNSQLVFDSQDHVTLDNGPHTFVIKPTGQKNEAATQDVIIHDRVVFYKRQ